MSPRLQLFVGPVTALAGFARIDPDARPLAPPLVAGRQAMSRLYGRLGFVPLTASLQDRLHFANGTGEWLSQPIDLTTTDLAFGARLSQGAALAYVEIEAGRDEADSPAAQAAALWVGGALRLGPICLAGAQARMRARSMWPVNSALRALGIDVIEPQDEAAMLGLYDFVDTMEMIAALSQ